MVVVYFSCNFDVVLQRGEPCLPMPPFDQKSMYGIFPPDLFDINYKEKNWSLNGIA